MVSRSRTKKPYLRKKTTMSTRGLDVKQADDAAKALESENVISDLLSCGLSGGEVERARQTLRKMSTSELVSINNNRGRIYLHDRDTGTIVLDFLSDIQTPTKKNENSLYLVGRLRIPVYLLGITVPS